MVFGNAVEWTTFSFLFVTVLNGFTTFCFGSDVCYIVFGIAWNGFSAVCDQEVVRTQKQCISGAILAQAVLSVSINVDRDWRSAVFILYYSSDMHHFWQATTCPTCLNLIRKGTVAGFIVAALIAVAIGVGTLGPPKGIWAKNIVKDVGTSLYSNQAGTLIAFVGRVDHVSCRC